MSKTLPCAHCSQLPTVYYAHNSGILVMCRPCTIPGNVAGGSNLATALAAWNTLVVDENAWCPACHEALGECARPAMCKASQGEYLDPEPGDV